MAAVALGLFALAFALAALRSPAWIPALFGSLASGVVALATVVIDSRGKHVSLRDGVVEYRDVWRTVRVELSRVRGAFATATEDGLYLAVRSSLGAVVRVDQEFADGDRRRFAEALAAQLEPSGTRIVTLPRDEFWPLLSEFERSPEEHPQLPWRALILGGFGGILALVSIPIVVSIQRVDSLLVWLIPLVAGIAALGAAAESRVERWAILALWLFGCTAILLGAYSLLAPRVDALPVEAAAVYAFVVAAGVAMLWEAMTTPRQTRQRKLEVERKCDLSHGSA